MLSVENDRSELPAYLMYLNKGRNLYCTLPQSLLISSRCTKPEEAKLQVDQK